MGSFVRFVGKTRLYELPIRATLRVKKINVIIILHFENKGEMSRIKLKYHFENEVAMLTIQWHHFRNSP